MCPNWAVISSLGAPAGEKILDNLFSIGHLRQGELPTICKSSHTFGCFCQFYFSGHDSDQFELGVTCDAQRRLCCAPIFGSAPIFGRMHHPSSLYFGCLQHPRQLWSCPLYFWIFTILGTQDHSGWMSWFKQNVPNHTEPQMLSLAHRCKC